MKLILIIIIILLTLTEQQIIPKNCLTWNSNKLCQSCNQNYFLANYTYPNNTIIPLCIPCGIGCTSCSDYTGCHRSNTSSYMADINLKINHVSYKIAASCGTNCLSCNNYTTCNECSTDFYLIKTQVNDTFYSLCGKNMNYFLIQNTNYSFILCSSLWSLFMVLFILYT